MAAASARGMSLSFIAPAVREGKPVVQLKKEVVEDELKDWQNALILYIPGAGGESWTMSSVLNFVEQKWSRSMVAKPTLVFHEEDGYFSVKFKSLEDRNMVLCSGPYFVGGRYMIMKPWNTKLKFQKDVFLTSIPLWVQLPNLPLNFWRVDSLSRIGSVIGEPLYVDECTSRKSRISYARVLIDTDVTTPLPDSVTIEDPSTGKTFVQKVVFEWRPALGDNANKLKNKYSEFLAPLEKDKLIASVEYADNWLHEDKEDETKSVAATKLQELKQDDDLIKERYTEYKEPQTATQMLNYRANCYRYTATSNDNNLNHMFLQDKSKVLNPRAETESWRKHKKQQQDALPKYASPVLATADMEMTKDSPVLATADTKMTKDSPVLATADTKMTKDSPVLATADTKMTKDEIVRLYNPITMKAKRAPNDKEATLEPRQSQKRNSSEDLIHQLQQHQDALRELLAQISVKRQPLLLQNSEAQDNDAVHCTPGRTGTSDALLV